MKPKTPIPVVKVDYTKKAWEQTTTALHNRWHPDIPAVKPLSPPSSGRGSILGHDSCLAARCADTELYLQSKETLKLMFAGVLTDQEGCSCPGGKREGRRCVPGRDC